MTQQVDITIVGAGAVGLATAYAISRQQPGLSITLIDKEANEAQHQTGHNSGVIHSGIYYKPGSLKATNCIRGYQMLLDFARKHEVPHDICGKLIVATHPDEEDRLLKIYRTGMENGLTGLQLLSASEAGKIEPHVRIHRAIRVPQTGIIDFPALASRLRALSEKQGVTTLFSAPFHSAAQHGDQLVVRAGESEWTTQLLINCAGLYADKVAHRSGVDPGCQIIPFRGEYYELTHEKRQLINHLVYPVPNPDFPFLGVHFTRMIHGGIEAGPNAVLAFRREGYSKWDLKWSELLETLGFKGFRKLSAKYWKTGIGEIYRSYNKQAFANALKKLLPEIQAQDLVAGGSGVRAQACLPDGSLVDDFWIVDNPNMIHVINAPSPAATSCLSIGETIATKAFEKLSLKTHKN